MRIHLLAPHSLRAQPAHDAAVVAELAIGAKLMVDGFKQENGEQWLSIVLPGGTRGYLPETAQVEKASPSEAELSVMLATATARPPGRRGIRNMVIGGGWLGISLAVTVFTYLQAWLGHGDGTFYLLWGLAAFGAIRLTLGIMQYRRGE